MVRGNDLHSFLLRLGRLFALSQRRVQQSEPERTHFTIRETTDPIAGEARTLLDEAVKWSVLFEEKETKAKRAEGAPVVDYVLNPIYAPYFQISYRKGRKLELSVGDFNMLVIGSAEDYSTLYGRLRSEWSIDQPDALRCGHPKTLVPNNSMEIELRRGFGPAELQLPEYALALSGRPLDERGEAAVSTLSGKALALRTIEYRNELLSNLVCG